MTLKTWRFLALLLASLAMTMTSAHVLELPQKMRYNAQLYSAVNTTMYRYFAIVGGVYSMSSIIAAAIVSFLTRKDRLVFRWALAGTLLLVLWFISWLTVVNPVNNEVAAALRSAPETVPEIWMQLRVRWEYGHLVGFVLQLLGLSALIISVLVDTPRSAASRR